MRIFKPRLILIFLIPFLGNLANGADSNNSIPRLFLIDGNCPDNARALPQAFTDLLSGVIVPAVIDPLVHASAKALSRTIRELSGENNNIDTASAITTGHLFGPYDDTTNSVPPMRKCLWFSVGNLREGDPSNPLDLRDPTLLTHDVQIQLQWDSSGKLFYLAPVSINYSKPLASNPNRAPRDRDVSIEIEMTSAFDTEPFMSTLIPIREDINMEEPLGPLELFGIQSPWINRPEGTDVDVVKAALTGSLAKVTTARARVSESKMKVIADTDAGEIARVAQCELTLLNRSVHSSSEWELYGTEYVVDLGTYCEHEAIARKQLRLVAIEERAQREATLESSISAHESFKEGLANIDGYLPVSIKVTIIETKDTRQFFVDLANRIDANLDQIQTAAVQSLDPAARIEAKALDIEQTGEFCSLLAVSDAANTELNNVISELDEIATKLRITDGSVTDEEMAELAKRKTELETESPLVRKNRLDSLIATLAFGTRNSLSPSDCEQFTLLN